MTFARVNTICTYKEGKVCLRASIRSTNEGMNGVWGLKRKVLYSKTMSLHTKDSMEGQTDGPTKNNGTSKYNEKINNGRRRKRPHIKECGVATNSSQKANTANSTEIMFGNRAARIQNQPLTSTPPLADGPATRLRSSSFLEEPPSKRAILRALARPRLLVFEDEVDFTVAVDATEKVERAAEICFAFVDDTEAGSESVRDEGMTVEATEVYVWLEAKLMLERRAEALLSCSGRRSDKCGSSLKNSSAVGEGVTNDPVEGDGGGGTSKIPVLGEGAALGSIYAQSGRGGAWGRSRGSVERRGGIAGRLLEIERTCLLLPLVVLIELVPLLGEGIGEDMLRLRVRIGEGVRRERMI